jgi:hypothetical protein
MLVAEGGVRVPRIQVEAETVLRPVFEASVKVGRGCFLVGPGGVLVAKLGITRSVGDSARAALLDLLGYRRAFDEVLSQQEAPYGLGLAWGAELLPHEDEVLLCSPDQIGPALGLLGLN